MAAPAVSIVMPVRDGERFLQSAIDSVLAQSFTDFELIVIDDGSSDSTLAILAEAARRDPRIVVVSKGSMGIVAALNLGLAMARSPLVARLDADDIALPGRLARQVETMQRDPVLGVLGGFAELIDESGRTRCRRLSHCDRLGGRLRPVAPHG
jgi:glycosyltransferase involved in cell wall biosynthesis